MLEHGSLIVGYVDTPGGHDALALGMMLADAQSSPAVTVAEVYDPLVSDTETEPWGTGRETAELDLVAARQLHGTRPGTSFTTCRGASVADGLHRLADELAAATIVVGTSHRRGLGRVVPGSATAEVLHGAPAGVAIAPKGFADREGGPLRTVAVAYDGSPEASQALDRAAEIAAAHDARLRILAVWDPTAMWFGVPFGPMLGLEQREAFERMLDGAQDRMRATVSVSTAVLEGTPAHQLTRAADGCDLLVLGSRSHGPVRRTLLGSVSTRLARDPSVPLLVVPRSAKKAPTGGEERLVEGAAG